MALRYRAGLPPEAQVNFDRLRGLLASPRPDLGWYHAVGLLVLRLQPGAGRAPYGGRWLGGLAAAAGHSAAVLRRARLFASGHTQREAADLARRGLGWSQLVLTLPVAEPKARRRLQRQAADGDWSAERVRLEVRALQPPRRPGGRPPATPRNHGCRASLQELRRLTDQWLRFHRHAWAGGEGSAEGELRALPRGRYPEGLADELARGREAVGDLLQACRQVLGRLDGLLAGKARGRRARGHGGAGDRHTREA
jgi:hypothetical protein